MHTNRPAGGLASQALIVGQRWKNRAASCVGRGRWRRDGDGRRGGNNCWEEWLRMRIDLVRRWRWWRWWKVLDWKEGFHFKASVATAVKATETRLGTVKVWDTKGPAGGLVVLAQMVGERWDWWTRQQGVVWFREVRELLLEVRL